MVSAPHSGLTVRLAKPQDYPSLAEIFNRAHREYAGFVVRTADDLEWRCRSQPGMSDQGAFVVEDRDGSPQGYAFVKKNGRIIEFAVDPGGPQYDVATTLMSECEAYAIDRGATRIRVNVPTLHRTIERAMDDAGLTPATPEAKHYVAATQPAHLVQALADMGPVQRSGVAQVVITNPLPWETETATVRFGHPISGALSFEMHCDRQTINDLMLGARSPWWALAQRRLRIKPIRQIVVAVAVIKQLRVAAPWFHTIGGVL